MRFIDAQELAAAAPYGGLADAIERAYAEGVAAPPRAHHPVSDDLQLLTLPAWQSGRFIGVKSVTVAEPGRSAGLSAIQGVYLWFDGESGTPLAVMDGAELTARRTAATAALALRYLARTDAATHLIIGAGKLAPYVAKACLSIRPITRTLIHARKPERAAAVVSDLRRLGIEATAASDLDACVARADIISCVTSARQPVLYGSRITPGTHINLIGSLRPDMRECDDQTVARGRLFVDDRDNALDRSGDLATPIRRGVIDEGAIEADLARLVADGEPVPRARTDITVFKSVGHALQDYAAADLVWKRVGK